MREVEFVITPEVVVQLTLPDSNPGFARSCEVVPPPAVTVNVPELVAVPADVVTEIGPVVAPDGTLVLIWVLLTTLNDADVPLNFTAEAPLKLLPLMVTEVPAAPLVGEKLEIDGGFVGALVPQIE